MKNKDAKTLDRIRAYLKKQSKIDWNLKAPDMDMFIDELIHFIDKERGLTKPPVLDYDYELPKAIK